MVYVTALIASILVMFYFRAHGDFSENIPLSLVLLFALEINGAPYVLVVMLGVCLIFGQYVQMKWAREAEDAAKNRLYGVKFTSLTLALLALANVLWIGYLLIEATRFATGVFIH